MTVDKSTGEVQKAGAFTNSDYTPQEAEIKYFIAEFVKNARSIGYDPVAYSNMQTKAGHFLTMTAAQKYASTMKDDQNKKLGKYTVSVKNLSVQKVPESDSSYLVRWTEEVVEDQLGRVPGYSNERDVLLYQTPCQAGRHADQSAWPLYYRL